MKKVTLLLLSCLTSSVGSALEPIQAQIKEEKFSRDFIFHPSLRVPGLEEIVQNSKWYKVQPNTWWDSPYFSYETVALPINRLFDAIPELLQIFSENLKALDPAKFEKIDEIDRFRTTDLGAGYNPGSSKDPWYSEKAPGFFLNEDGILTEALEAFPFGIVDKAYGPVKHLYPCIETRDVTQKNETDVSTRSGWYLMGGPPENTLNGLALSTSLLNVTMIIKLCGYLELQDFIFIK